MTIIRVKGFDINTFTQVQVDQEIYELLECICDTRKEELQYMFDVALDTANEHGFVFSGFEIIAE